MQNVCSGSLSRRAFPPFRSCRNVVSACHTHGVHVSVGRVRACAALSVAVSVWPVACLLGCLVACPGVSSLIISRPDLAWLVMLVSLSRLFTSPVANVNAVKPPQN